MINKFMKYINYIMKFNQLCNILHIMIIIADFKQNNFNFHMIY